MMMDDEAIAKLHIAVADQQVMIYAFWRLLADMVYDRKSGENRTPTEEELEKLREILDMELPMVRKLLVCECGHVIADHDHDGCSYIGCRNVCVRGNGQRDEET